MIPIGVERPPGRDGSLFINIPDKNQYLLFSGVSHMRYADVFIFDMKTRKWSKKSVTGEQPKELCYAVGWYDSPHFFFYGGRNKELSLSDTYFLDVDKWIWKKVSTMDQPLSRFYHAGVKTEEKAFYIYGGTNIGRENKLLGDMFKYDYTNLNYNEGENDKVGGSVWTAVTFNGNITPGPRKGHTMAYYQGYFILFGGETERGFCDDNFYKFSRETKTWSILKVSGVNPGYRAYHTMDFFKKNTLVIFGGKVKPKVIFGGRENSKEKKKDYEVTDSLIYFDLEMMNCSNPFVGDIGPSPRFGHACAYNAQFDKRNKPFIHCIVGGLDKSYCSMDIYFLKEIELKEDNKWVYVQKNMHNTQKIDGSDEVFETAKKTIIQFKKKLEEVTKENIQVNKVYSEYFQTLHKYNKSIQDENFSSNEKKSQLQEKKCEIEKEKRQIIGKSRELKDYNNLLNSYCILHRDKYKALRETMILFMGDIKLFDKIFEKVDKSANKQKLFNGVNLDSLTVKRRNYKEFLQEFDTTCKEYSLFEKSIYDDIQMQQNEQKEKFKNMYFIIDDKQQLNFKEDDEKEEDLSKQIIK